ncbi:hypothetical protein [Leifsonia poae]|uniref:hypothetical protein n=1 Tax=Leifsonia poae TaxID=110933 RepID=UPI003D670F8F
MRVECSTNGEPTIIERCQSFRPLMDDGHFFSHVTAAIIYGLPVPPEHEASRLIHVSVMIPRRAPRGDGIIGHKLRVDPDTLRLWNGLRVPPPIEVWCELASMMSIDDLIVAGDAIVRRRDPLGSTADLASAAADAVNRPGVKRLRSALESIRARTDSPMETRLRLAIARAGLPEPEVNWAVLGTDGSFKGFADLAFPQYRVIVEYDGDQHRSDPDQYFSDVDRLWTFQTLEWRIVRVNKSHTANGCAEAIDRIRTALAQQRVATRRRS